MSFVTSFHLTLSLGLVQYVSAFTLWPLVDPQGLSGVLNISTTCISALNATLACDADLFQWTSKVDNVYWTEDNTTQLCSADCIDDSRQWKEEVSELCDGEFLRSGDRYVEADTLATRFVEGLEIACLQSDAGEWCLVDSQEWVGSDVIRPDCAADPSDPWCINPANVSSEYSRMANVYDDELLCSECFLKLMHARISSEFLPDEDHSDYLVEQFQDIQHVCQTTIVDTVMTRSLPNYPVALTATPTYGEAPATVTETEPEELTCAENQVVINVRYTTSNSSVAACNEIAVKYGVATGNLVIGTGNHACYVDSGEICGPPPCQLYRVREGDTCESIATAVSNGTDSVHGAQLATWNPNILGACDHLSKSQYICVTRPGGSWVPPPIDSIPDDNGGPVRGGPGTTPTLEIVDNPATPIDPLLLQEGIAEACTRYVLASSGANCWKIANDGGIAQSRLFELNPVLGSTGEFCDTMVWKDYYYCIGVNGEGSPVTTTTTADTSATPSTTGVPKPTNTQAGQPSNCNNWIEAAAGAGCWSLYTDAGIDAARFYEWNPVLGTDGANCGTQIWPGYSYCIGTSSSSPSSVVPTPTTTASGPPKPTATQAGIAPNCNKFVQAVSGDYCWKLANDAGIDTSLLYQWNTVLGSSGENCGTQIWPDYYYCVGVSA